MKQLLRRAVAYSALAAAGVGLSAAAANATDATRIAAPAEGNWNNGANWTSSPGVPDGTATFGQSTQTAITFSVNPTNVQTIQSPRALPHIPSTPALSST